MFTIIGKVYGPNSVSTKRNIDNSRRGKTIFSVALNLGHVMLIF